MQCLDRCFIVQTRVQTILSNISSSCASRSLPSLSSSPRLPRWTSRVHLLALLVDSIASRLGHTMRRSSLELVRLANSCSDSKPALRTTKTSPLATRTLLSIPASAPTPAFTKLFSSVSWVAAARPMRLVRIEHLSSTLRQPY